MAAALRVSLGLLALVLVLRGCVAIYEPDEGVAVPGTPGEEDDDEGAGVLTVHAGKRKPSPGARGPPPPPPAAGREGCPEPSWGRAARARTRRSPPKSKPLPVRQRVVAKREARSDFLCPESWRGLDLAAVLEPRELECPANATGWFPFPPDCRKYLSCWKGRGFLRACAPTTLFNPVRRECDSPEKVKCLPDCRPDPDENSFTNADDSEAISPVMMDPGVILDVDVAKQAASDEPPVVDSRRPPRRRRRQAFNNARLAGAGAVQCDMDGGTGLAAHPTDCTRFINCWKGKPHVQSCAPGTLFNPALNACDHPHKVPECRNGKRGPPADAAGPGSGAPAAGYTLPAGGGFNQFGNQGYQPPPRQTFKDNTASGSSFVPNQVAPPTGHKAKHLHPEPPPSQQFGRGPGAPSMTVDVVGPLPHGHSDAWHREHGVPMPAPGPHHHHHQHHQQQPPAHGYPHHHHPPAGHNPQHGGHPHPQAGHNPQHGGYPHPHGGYNPHQGSYGPQGGYHTLSQGGYSPTPGRYTPQQGAYGTQTGSYTPPSGGYTPQSGGGFTPAQGGYTPPPYPSQSGYGSSGGGYNPYPGQPEPGKDPYNPGKGAYNPSLGSNTPSPHGVGHNAKWHKDHGVPLPDGGRRPESGLAGLAATTPAYPAPTTTCAPDPDEDADADLDYDIDLRTGGSSNWINILERTKNGSMPQSGQMVRLRGGPTPLEGYVEVMGPGSRWGSVCDSPSEWTVEEASIVCRMLGYERGAELAWQGRPRAAVGALPVHVEAVRCAGHERSLMSCAMDPGDAGDGCSLETQAAGLRCFPNWAVRCRPGEKPFKGSCYSVVVPRQDRKVDAIAFSQDEAIRHCRSQGGHLLDINSQAESDFVSEWLTSAYPALGSVLTAGVGVSVPGRDVWVWEGTGAPFQYNLWWPGPPSKEFSPERAPKVGERSLCVLLKKDFPCSSWPGAGAGGGRGGGGQGYGNWQGARSCGAEYFYWHAEDCAIRQRAYPYVCERKADEVGCLGPAGSEYTGAANVSWNGRPCVAWDSPAAASALRYRVAEAVRMATLAGHNHCRRLDADHEPWCYVDAGQAGIMAEKCDIPPCRDNAAVSRAAVHCGPQQFECGPNECIPSVWQCDGEADCSNGLDEKACSNYLLEFRAVEAAKLERHDVERWLHLDANTCARRCLDSTEFVCKSFSYKVSTKVCLLSGSNLGETGSLQRANRTAWTYYERLSTATPCLAPSHFLCGNGKCLNATQHCDGRNDCGDKSDEAAVGADACTPQRVGWQLRLAGGKAANEGRVEVRVNGEWGAVCDDGFGLAEADVACREAGYPDGAVEVLAGGALPGQRHALPIMMDELYCVGNETSLVRCDHAGWKQHDCTPEEVVGVRCATAAGLECVSADGAAPELHGGFAWGAILQLATKHCRQSSRACPENQWQCKSGECVPANFLCDSAQDCKDGSDEDDARCEEPRGVRLAGGANDKEGRVEVRMFGEWGTVCDDDFNEAAAVAVCRSLGMPGHAKVLKDAHFGRGQGIIWMDDVQCAGNETALEDCRHADFGVTNCKHDEDVGVQCLGGDESAARETLRVKAAADRHVDVSKYLPAVCGSRRALDDEFTPSVQLAKVVSGRGTPRGAYPWQASIRVRSGLKSVHWCGAVLVGPSHVLTAAHCVQDYTKGAYFIRVGDFNSEEDDGSEQEANIESIHVHEDFNKNVYLENDVALIRVSGAGFQFTDSVQPACVPKPSTPYTPGTNCSISGWGSVGTSGAGHSRLLRSAWLPILPTDSCSAPSVYGKKAIVGGMFCAGHLSGGADSCQGDSGGPMVCLANKDRFTLYGIISWGHGCGMPNKPGVYTNVAHYMEWVHDKIRESVRLNASYGK